MKEAFLPFLVVLLGTVQAVPDEKAKIESYSDADAYAVYAAVIPKVFEFSKPKTIVIQQETETYARGDSKHYIKGNSAFQTAWGTTIQAFERANRTSKLLQPMFPTGTTYVLLPSATITELTRKSDCKEFKSRYPDAYGHVSMSSVGFNPEKTKAILTMDSLSCEAGGGQFYLMEKKDGRWVEADLPNVTSWRWAT